MGSTQVFGSPRDQVQPLELGHERAPANLRPDAAQRSASSRRNVSGGGRGLWRPAQSSWVCRRSDSALLPAPSLGHRACRKEAGTGGAALHGLVASVFAPLRLGFQPEASRERPGRTQEAGNNTHSNITTDRCHL